MSNTASQASGPPSNRLAHETSPYLQQHARNPVDWYPWGEEALEKARDEDKPIFLSIGYSACHWCHVMEHESFEDASIAELMNRHFVCIKVDREERPDLDQIYMNAVQLLTGRGGWPMSVFLTPDLRPFYGGTYWPPESRMGMPGFRDILEKVTEAWQTRRDAVTTGAEELTRAVARSTEPHGEPTALGDSLLRTAMQALLRSADRTNGGFGGAPKFPHPMDLRLLLRCWKRFGNDDALHVVTLTCDKMARGGIYDHLGGGFHRYSTDARWLVPHFEKMLYDNALLVPAYLELFQATGDRSARRVVRETLDYVLREMAQSGGGFYSTQDADSEGVEGRFFVWTADEIEQLLGPDDARIFCYCYDVTPEGNWEGHNILNRVKTHAQAAAMLKIDEQTLEDVLARCRQRPFDVRSQRVAPGRDDKILVAWNGLMIAAMSQAAAVLGEENYVQAARDAARFILTGMRDDRGRLLHSFKDGHARINAFLDDYACFIDGLVELYQATFEDEFLVAAVELAGQMLDRFDDPNGGFFYTPADHERLIARNRDTQDTATPSGNGMAATVLLKLARLCGRGDYEAKAAATLESLSGQMAQFPSASGQSLIALDFLLGPANEIVLVDGDDPERLDELLRIVRGRFLPNKVVARRFGGMSDDALPAPLVPLLTGKKAVEGQGTAYICEQGVCHEPLVGAEALEVRLSGGHS